MKVTCSSCDEMTLVTPRGYKFDTPGQHFDPMCDSCFNKFQRAMDENFKRYRPLGLANTQHRERAK